jgi:uncharacterized membrane protein
MSFQERRAIVSLLGTILITAIYAAFMAQRYPDTGAYSPEVFRFWGTFFLILVLVSIVAKVGIHIVFSIIYTIHTREKEPSAADERDKLIELKSSQTALYVFMAGFLLAMGTLVMDLPPATMFVALLGAGVVAALVSDIAQFYYYRRGF